MILCLLSSLIQFQLNAFQPNYSTTSKFPQFPNKSSFHPNPSKVSIKLLFTLKHDSCLQNKNKICFSFSLLTCRSPHMFSPHSSKVHRHLIKSNRLCLLDVFSVLPFRATRSNVCLRFGGDVRLNLEL
jgi:hypothetical protein